MPTPQELTAQQKTLWSAAAPGWERSSQWFDENAADLSDWLCTAAGMKPGSVVLDLACGAGEPSCTAARRVQPGGRVVATDLSPQMIDVTRRKAQRLGLDNLEAREMDAQALEFPDASFDAVTCRFGLMFCPDLARAASEVRRVLKPGGRFALAVWGPPERNPFFTSISSFVAELVPPPPPDPNLPGIFRLAPPGAVEQVLRAAGFSGIAVEARPATLTYPSLDEYWQIQTDLAGPLRPALARMTPDTLEQLKAKVFAALKPHARGGAVRLAAFPLCASATRSV